MNHHVIRIILIKLFVFVIAGAGNIVFAGNIYKTICNDSLPHQILITDQNLNRLLIVDANKRQTTWEWLPARDGIDSANVEWFHAISEVKPVFNSQYILTVASGGGMALIRITDKKVLFYAYAGGNTHSAAMLPDGNIVTASSTGNYLMVFHTDTLSFPNNVYSKKIYLPFAHNTVWDRKRQVLWSAGKNKIYKYSYNFICQYPDLILLDSIKIDGDDAHDLYPDYGKDSLWVTTPEHVFKFSPADNKIVAVNDVNTVNIKSVSSGPEGYKTIMMKPKEKWWTDEVNDADGSIIYQQDSLKIYKARWLLNNDFSERENEEFTPCR